MMSATYFGIDGRPTPVATEISLSATVAQGDLDAMRSGNVADSLLVLADLDAVVFERGRSYGSGRTHNNSYR